MIDDNRRTSFDRNAALYDAARPSYDLRAIDVIRELGPRVLEIGAGTGKATELLARVGLHVTAVEPGATMAAALRAKDLPRVRVVEARFEDVVEHDYDTVVAAQAWHWMDPAKKYVLAAAAAPHLVLLYNIADFELSLRAELDAVYAAHWVGDAARLQPVVDHRAKYETEIRDSGVFAPPRIHDFAWTQRYTTQQYLDLIATYSDHAVLPQANRDALFAAIAAIIDRAGGEVVIPYATLAFVARRLG
ncbi:MAG: class I SAM-dependent methyltransferase [Deltaproteobacteria bacterium]|nr:class I SAM-dependent methyltransferase [Deltaproteobacteria bacterium]